MDRGYHGGPRPPDGRWMDFAHDTASITTDIYAHVMPHRRRELTRAISQIVLGGK